MKGLRSFAHLGSGHAEDRLIKNIDKKKSEVAMVRGTKRYGRIIRNENGTIRKVMV